MHSTLSAVWEQVTDLLAAGVSIIPVRDQEQEGKPPKSPYAKWKEFQGRIITPEELWHDMEHFNTSAVAIVCGEVSGNLEAIDIDVKNWPGIDALFFEAIREIYPSLWERLRIHSTPSGGYHVLYRCHEPIKEGNQKLATLAGSMQAGIETRGEGGYIVAPPSLGYQVYQDRQIPRISPDMRESLVNLARSLNQKIRVAAQPAVEQSASTYYDTNPFEHFNQSPAGDTVLLDRSWTAAGGNANHLYFTRPGKSNGISASFNRTTRLYYIFTTSTPLDAERAYHPSTILATLDHGGDKRATYRWLVDQGYGKIKPRMEQQLVQAKATTGKDLPANVSPEAKVVYLEKRTALQTRYPHGAFWDLSEKGAVSLNRERTYAVASAIGFRYHEGSIVWIDGRYITRVIARQFYDRMKAYIGVDEDVCNAFEAFIQRSGEFTMTRLELLDTTRLLESTATTSYKFYANGYLKITASGISPQPYTELSDQLIWRDRMLDRDFTLQDLNPEGLYYQFLELAIGVTDYLHRAIGYLCHEHKEESNTYMIMLVEECPNPKQGGGTGKNLFTNLIGHATTLKNIAGSQAQLNEKLLQAWNYERVMAIHDLPRKFNLPFFKEPSGGSATLKKLFKDEQSLPPSVMPKFIFSTNFSYDDTDGGLRRRLIPLEFKPFFTIVGGVDRHFGKLFPYDWSPEDWTQYDNFIAYSIQQYLVGGGKLSPRPLTEDGWLKQFDQNHMQLTREFIQQHWDYFLREKFISNEKFRDVYLKFSSENNIERKYQLSSMRMTQALEEWCNHYKTSFLANHVKRDLLDLIRGRYFGSEPTAF
jgi:hypothetical protein